MGPRKCKGMLVNGKRHPCIFNPATRRAPANAKVEGQCMMCNGKYLKKVCTKKHTRGCLVYQLHRMKLMDTEVFESAVKRIPDEFREEMVQAVESKENDSCEESEAVKDPPEEASSAGGTQQKKMQQCGTTMDAGTVPESDLTAKDTATNKE